MIYAMAFSLLLLLASVVHAAGPTTIPTTTTTLPQSAGVPGVLKQPVTSSGTSSVTASPDVSYICAIAALNATCDVPMSGHTALGVATSTGMNAAITASVSTDNGVTFPADTYFVQTTSTTSNPVFAFIFNTAREASVFIPGGVTHVRLKVTTYTSGSTTLTATTTMGQVAGYTVQRADSFQSSTTYALVTKPMLTGGNTAILGPYTFGLPGVAPLGLGGTRFTLRATGAAFTPVVVTATQPPHPVMTFNGRTAPNSGFPYSTYAIDAVVIRILAPAITPTTVMGRVVRRHVMYASTQTAAPAAGVVPTCAALAYTGAANGGGSFLYKYVAVDIWGNEGNLSAASAACAPAANNGETVTMPAVPAGAAGYNVYRTKTGPGATYFFVGRTNTTTFRDITPDSQLTLAAGAILPWGTLPTSEGPLLFPVELVMEKFVALGTAPTIMSTQSYPAALDNNRLVTIAPGVAVGRYRIPGEVESKAFLAAPTITTALARDIDVSYTNVNGGGGSFFASQQNAVFGDLAVNSFNIADAAIGGTFVVWGHELVGVTDAVSTLSNNAGANQLAGLAEGTTLVMKWVAPPVFTVGDEIAIEIGSSATSASVVLEVMVTGRFF